MLYPVKASGSDVETGSVVRGEITGAAGIVIKRSDSNGGVS
jgi:hypothetical protein